MTHLVVFLPVAASQGLVDGVWPPVRPGHIDSPVVSIQNSATFHLKLISKHYERQVSWHHVLLDGVPDLLEGLLLGLLGLAARGVILVHVEALEEWSLESVKQIPLVDKDAENNDT